MRDMKCSVFFLMSMLLFQIKSVNAEEGQFAVIDSGLKTPLRYFSVVGTDVARTADGSLVKIDPVNARLAKDKKTGEWVRASIKHFGGTPSAKEYRLFPAKEIVHSPLPGADWMSESYADYNWARVQGGLEAPQEDSDLEARGYDMSDLMSKYKSLATLKVRSRFFVKDPSKVGDLMLRIQYRGGAVVYVNGKEVGRYDLPQGPLSWETCAKDYPKEVYMRSAGGLLGQSSRSNKSSRNYESFHDMRRWVKDDWKRLAQRSRVQQVTIPAGFLKEGVNVLALGLHRSAAIPEMFTTSCGSNGRYPIHPYRLSHWWNRVSLEAVELRASKSAQDFIVPNVSCPDTLIISNHPATQPVTTTMYGDPYEKLGPVEIQAMPQGVYSGALVASSSKEIQDLKVTVDDLTGSQGAISKSHIQVMFQKFDGPTRRGFSITPGPLFRYFDTLESYVPGKIGMQKRTAWEAKNKAPVPSCIVQPIWFLVKVPANTKAGVYKGFARVTSAGNEEIKVPLEVTVAGNWQVPKPADIKMFVVLDQSPETLAITYDVPLWSDKHWALIEQSFSHLAEIGNKEILITFTPKTYTGNDHAMLYFERDGDGQLKANFSVVDRYVELAAKHMGPIPSVCTIVSYGDVAQTNGSYRGLPVSPQRVTVYDAQSKTYKE